MLISELAARTGLFVHALRHYEKLGMIAPARRPSGYREYSDAMRKQAVFIAMSRKIGFSLKEIAAQLPAYRSGRVTHAQMADAMQARVAHIDQQIATLTTQRRAVLAHIAWMAKQQRIHATRRAQGASGQGRAPWPAVPKPVPSRSRTTRKSP